MENGSYSDESFTPGEGDFLDEELNPHYDPELADRALDETHHALLIEEALARKGFIRDARSNLTDEVDYIAAQERFETARSAVHDYEVQFYGR